MIALLIAALLQEPPPPPRPPERPRRESPEDQQPPRRPPVPRPPGEDGPFFPPAVEQPAFDPEAVKTWLKDNEPETYRRVLRAGEGGRRPEAMRLLAEAEARMREAAAMKERDPKAYERLQELRGLERETLELAERARQAAPADREKAAPLLKEKLGRLFDLREESKAREVEELKRRVGELEKQLETRKASKERIVERRRRELLGERQADEW